MYLDFTNDLRRSLPVAITMFYAGQSAINGNDSPIQIRVKETDLRSQDIDLLRFELVPNLVLLLTTAGIVNAGLATAREWEDSTIKELLLAPISKAIIIAGKLLSGWITTLLIAAVVLVVGAASGYLRPADTIYWISTLVIVLLLALASAGLGVAIGAAAPRFQRVTAIGIPLSIDLFFLSGGITVAASYRGFQSTPYMIQFLYLHIPSSNKRLSIIEYQQYMIFKVSLCQWPYSKESHAGTLGKK